MYNKILKRRKRLLYWYLYIHDNIEHPRKLEVLQKIAHKYTYLKCKINENYGAKTSSKTYNR